MMLTTCFNLCCFPIYFPSQGRMPMPTKNFNPNCRCNHWSCQWSHYNSGSIIVSFEFPQTNKVDTILANTQPVLGRPLVIGGSSLCGHMSDVAGSSKVNITWGNASIGRNPSISRVQPRTWCTIWQCQGTIGEYGRRDNLSVFCLSHEGVCFNHLFKVGKKGTRMGCYWDGGRTRWDTVCLVHCGKLKLNSVSSFGFTEICYWKF